MKKTNCSVCGKQLDFSSGRYCLKCHSEYMRNWRKNNPMTDLPEL
jgi:predicted amidophosphoribosyltransferase